MKFMIEEIRAFCAVVEEKSLAKAARNLGISSPKMTRHIQALENHLKIKLLNRSTRGISLTEAGEVFFQQALEVLCQYEAAIKSAQTLSHTVTGTVKLGIPVSINHLWVAPMLHKFCERYPEVNVHIINGDHLLSLLKGDFDIIIHCGVLPDSTYYFRKLRDWYKVTCAAPKYLKQHGVPQHPKDLQQYNCINHYNNYENCWRYCIDGEEQEIAIEPTIKINSSIAVKQVVLAGVGISSLPEFSIWKELQEGSLMTILDDFRAKPFGMYAVYPSKDYLPQKTLKMLDFLEPRKII